MPEIRIRPAVATDFDFVSSLMHSALSPYYGGDHVQHARRIFDTHISGGIDHLGFFSLEQRMFIAEANNEPAGVVHLVAKRQSNCKISPLIVHSDYRSGQGVGHTLLEFAESYARQIGSRQVYCTVADNNHSALRFFCKHGYIIAGKSPSHYKVGVTEAMLYKVLVSEQVITEFDREHISVLPLTEDHKPQVRDLLLGRLPGHFVGIDNEWIERLFAGYNRREERDISLKYKLIFTASDRKNRVLGVAGATPKKGEPIKLMPLVAETEPAFFALIADLPQFLSDFGRKIYAHIIPTSKETRFLQQSGWTLDGVLPDAYQVGQVTQQWGLDIDETRLMRVMRLKQRYLDYIRQGRKTLEVRVAYDSLRNISAGERLRFLSQSDQLLAIVKDVRRYSDFREMLAREDYSKIVPQMDKPTVEKLLREIYPPEKERLGILVIEIRAEPLRNNSCECLVPIRSDRDNRTDTGAQSRDHPVSRFDAKNYYRLYPLSIGAR